MASFLAETSNYIMTLALALFVICNVVFLVQKSENKHFGLVIAQNLLVILIHAVAYTTLYIRSGDVGYFFFFAYQELLLFGMMLIFRILYRKCSQLLLNNMNLLLMIGFIILGRLDMKSAIRQFVITIVAMMISLAIPFVLQKFILIWRKMTWLYCGIGVFLLTSVLLLSEVTHGSKLAFQLGFVAFQPSEFIKITLVFFIASMLKKSTDLKRILLSAGAAMAHILLLVLSKDLGMSAIYFVVYAFMLFIATEKIGLFAACTGIGGVAAVLAYLKFSHVRVRVQTWLNPWNDLDKKGYQLTQSLFAIGTGGWFGMGLLQGAPATIPYVNKDFIFSAIAEEMGVLFSLILLCVYLSILAALLQYAKQSGDMFNKLILSGFGIMMIFQVFLTVGGGTRFIPLTGVTLPLISTGGSSVASTLLNFAILQGIIMIVKKEAIAEENEHTEKTIEEVAAETTAVVKKKRALRFAMVSFMVLFVLMIANVCFFLINDSYDAICNSYNSSRAQALAKQNVRGTIFADSGEILAYTKQQSGDEPEERIYPYGEEFAHVVGFDTNGRMGIESIANMSLLKSDVSIRDKINADIEGRKNPGDNVFTTLQVNLQKSAYEALGDNEGAIIAMNPKTGAILAMVSKPDFDPATIDTVWNHIINDENNSVLLNRATQGVYPPGSIFKMIDTIEYLRENQNDYSQYTYECNGVEQFGDSQISCYHGTVHGTIDFKTAFAKSCNCAFAGMGNDFERKKFADTLQQMLFNSDLPIRMSYNKSKADITKETSQSDLLQAAIGQGTMQMTPIHVAMLTSAIANDGELMKPYIVSRVENAKNEIIHNYEPQSYDNIMTNEESDYLTELMVAVIEEGTGHVLKDAGYHAAGKTGSAEYLDNKTKSHAWFTGFAPYDNPEIVVTVLVENGGSGGNVAAPMAKTVMDAYFGK